MQKTEVVLKLGLEHRFLIPHLSIHFFLIHCFAHLLCSEGLSGSTLYQKSQRQIKEMGPAPQILLANC